MSDYYEKWERNGCTVKLYPDEDAQSPREDCDNLGTMVCFHSRYELGDKDNPFKDTQGDSREMSRVAKELGTMIMLPLFLLDHSGLRMRTGDFSDCDPGAWDSGCVGFIYVTKEKVREEYSVKRITKDVRKKVLDVLRGEVSTYDQYLSNDVWGYVVEDAKGEEVDSCWGFYGYEYAKEQANEAADGYTPEPEPEQTLPLPLEE